MSKLRTTLKDPDIDSRLLDERGATAERLTKSREAPLNLAHSKGQIDRGQWAAGQKLYMHWFKSWIAAHYGSVDLTRISSNLWNGPTLSEAQEAHERKFCRAMEILRAEKSFVLERFVCQERPLSDIGAEMGYNDREWGFRKALGVARKGLDILRKEWGIEST